MTDQPRTEIAVYLPDPDPTIRFDSAATAVIDRGSGIVGTPISEWIPDDYPGDLLVIDFEANRYRAVNIVTYADRVYHAYDRHATHYPTVSRLTVPPQTVTRVGTFYPVHGRVEVADGLALSRLADWIGCPLGYGGKHASNQLAAELRCTHHAAIA